MPRTCTICTHPKRKAIDIEIGKGTSYRNIAKHFSGASFSAIGRHVTGCVTTNAKAVAKARVETVSRVEQQRVDAQVESVVSIEAGVNGLYARISMLFDACDGWLRDPADPTKYTLDARSDEVHVVYLVERGDRTVQERATLHELLALAKISPERWEIRAADPRVLILKTAEQLTKQLELVARLRGEFKPDDGKKPMLQLNDLIDLVEHYRPTHTR